MNISRNDNRQYQNLTLNNGLRVLLIQDKEATKSAASLTVNAGHFDDPWQRQGLAHFVEHMLFLGTDTYPTSGEFSQFVSDNGGSNNAWTGTEHSCYFFDIDQQHFEHALKRFSRFFIAPLFCESQIDKERQAIDAEFRLKIKDDGRRIHQVHRETVNPSHPFAKFSVGNKDTLIERETNLRDELIAFFNTNYQAQFMTLVLSSPAPLEQTQQLATTLFSAVKGDATQGQKTAITEPLYRQKDLGKLIYIQPHKHLQKLVISFAMPNIDAFYPEKTVSFLAHLLGYEGKGSLHSVLKEQGWINNLSAGGGVNGSNYKDFNISLSLTDEGIEYYQDIVEMVFEYLTLIKQNPKALPALYQDKQSLLQIAFDNQEKGRLTDWLNTLSVNMHHYAPEHYIQGDYLMTGFDTEQFTQVLGWLNAYNMRVIIVHPDVDPSLHTQWYDTPYHVEPISRAWLDALAQINTPLSTMALPEVNPYLQRPVVLHKVMQKHATPQLLVDQEGLQFWYKQDTTFRVAKGNFYLALDSHYAIKDVQHIALTRLFADLFMDHIAERFYPAELAGINYHISAHQGGLTIHSSGLSANQHELMKELLNALFSADISTKRFAEYKKQLVRHWQSSNQNKPVNELFSRIGAQLMPWNPTPNNLAEALKNTSYNQFQQFQKQFFKALHVDAFLHGNWHLEHAKEFIDLVKHHVKPQHTIENLKRPVNSILDVQQLRLNLPCNDNAMVLYYQAQSQSIVEKVSLMAINHLINQEYFNALRTKQQLGYLVGVGYAPFNARAGVAFYVQSPNVDSQSILLHHRRFIEQYLQRLEALNEPRWQQFRQALHQQIAEKDKNLRLRSQRFWLAISNEDFDFNMQQRLLSAIDGLTLEHIKTYARSFFDEQRPRLELLSEAQGHKDQPAKQHKPLYS